MTTTNYYLEIPHFQTDEPIECYVDFDYTPYFAGSFDEAPDYGGVDLIAIKHNGVDIISSFTYNQIEEIEGMLASMDVEINYPDRDYPDEEYV